MDACRKIYTGVRWQKSSACHNLLLIPFWLRVTSRVVSFSEKGVTGTTKTLGDLKSLPSLIVAF